MLEVLKLEDRRFEGVKNCGECGYLEDCKAFWAFCPYTGRRVAEQRDDVEILEDAEVIP